jgi:sulfatase maturation enzyme AslB (radical SAM superfamily)
MSAAELLFHNAPPILVPLAERWHAQGRSFYLGPENIFWYGIQKMTWTAPLDIQQDLLSWRICTSDYLSPNYQMTAQDFTDLAEIFSSNVECTVCGIDTSPACNLRCHMCCYHTIDPYFVKHPQLRINIDIDTLYKRLENIASLGIQTIVLNASGEFLTYRYWREELAYAKKLGMSIFNIYSNGTLLTEENCKFIAAHGVKYAFISLHAVTFDTYKNFTGAANPALFETAVAGMKYLKKLGVNVVATITWSDVNSHEVEAFVTYWNDLGIDVRIIFEIVLHGNRMNSKVDVPFGWCKI